MKTHVWDDAFAAATRCSAPSRSRRKAVTEILRAAYRKHVRDRHTRLAIRRFLR